MERTNLLTDESVFFIYQQVKKPSSFILGAIQTVDDEVGVMKIKESEDIKEVMETVRQLKEQIGVAYAITNSVVMKRLLIKEKMNVKQFPLFLNETKKESERVTIYSSYKNLINGIDLQVETLTLGANLSLLDSTSSMGYVVDYAHIKTHTIAIMDYLAYKLGTPNIDRISNF